MLRTIDAQREQISRLVAESEQLKGLSAMSIVFTCFSQDFLEPGMIETVRALHWTKEVKQTVRRRVLTPCDLTHLATVATVPLQTVAGSRMTMENPQSE